MNSFINWISDTYRRSSLSSSPPRRSSRASDLAARMASDHGYSDVALAHSSASADAASYPPTFPPRRQGSSSLQPPSTYPSSPFNYVHPKISFAKIRQHLDPIWPELVDTLSYPATPESLAELSATIRPYQLPRDVRDALSVHDGQERESLGSTSKMDEWGIFYGLWYMSSEDIAEEYGTWRKYRDGLADVDDPFSRLPPLSKSQPSSSTTSATCPPGWIADTYTNPSWIPLLSDGFGNYIGLDLDPPSAPPPSPSSSATPSPSGCSLNPVPGQVIAFGRDIDIKTVLWPGGGPDSWARFLEQFADDLKSGVFATVNDGLEDTQGPLQTSVHQSNYAANGDDGQGSYDESSNTSESGDEEAQSDESDGLGEVDYYDQGVDRAWERESGVGAKPRSVGWKIQDARALRKADGPALRDSTGFKIQHTKSIVESLAQLSRDRWEVAGLFDRNTVSANATTPSTSSHNTNHHRPPALTIKSEPSQSDNNGPSTDHPLDPEGPTPSVSLTLSPPSPHEPTVPLSGDEKSPGKAKRQQKQPDTNHDAGNDQQSPSSLPPPPPSSASPSYRSRNRHEQPSPVRRSLQNLPPPAPISVPTLDDLLRDDADRIGENGDDDGLGADEFAQPSPSSFTDTVSSIARGGSPKHSLRSPELLPLSNPSATSLSSKERRDSDVDIGTGGQEKNTDAFRVVIGPEQEPSKYRDAYASTSITGNDTESARRKRPTSVSPLFSSADLTSSA